MVAASVWRRRPGGPRRPRRAAAQRARAPQGNDRRHRPLPALGAPLLPDARAAALARAEPAAVALPADLARALLRGLAATREAVAVRGRSPRPWQRGRPW